MTASEAIALILIGALAGTAAASVTGFNRRKQSGWIITTIIGILGAVVGSVLFDALNWTPPDVLNATITAAQILTAFVGAIVVIIIASFVQRN